MRKVICSSFCLAVEEKFSLSSRITAWHVKNKLYQIYIWALLYLLKSGSTDDDDDDDDDEETAPQKKTKKKTTKESSDGKEKEKKSKSKGVLCSHVL